MDVPSWHPANEDASAMRRNLLDPSAITVPRTEFKVMPGSSADTSTEAGRVFVSELSGSGNDGSMAGHGFFDASDRLYLAEQKKFAEAAKHKRKAEMDAQLLSFRSTALKLQAAAQKPSLVLVPEPTAATAKQPQRTPTTGVLTSAVVTIKLKKRRSASDIDTAKLSGKSSSKRVKTAKNKPVAVVAKEPVAVVNTTPTVSVTGALLVGYSSSSSDDEKEDDKA